MTYPFRTIAPKRTYTGEEKPYQSHKSQLAADFHHHCGYTDCTDVWFGGQRTFQIDHFKPWKKHKEHKALLNDYHNLVYCCSYVNRAKSDDDNSNYLDPCDVDYNLHFERDETGTIVGKTSQGQYMVNKLHLNLQRYAIIWNLERLTKAIDKLKVVAHKMPELSPLLHQLEDMYYDYSQYLFKNQ